MSYIVFDLEWNQPEGVRAEDTDLQFEIIEIGAVKLNARKEIVSKYQTLIRPQVYDTINWRIRKMLDLKPGELQRGKRFPEAAQRFMDWCGDSPIYCSWGAQDLTELQRNMAYYGMAPMSDRPIRYLNVQKLYGVMIGEETRSKSLEAAVDQERIIKDVPFHRAYSDAYYTSKILRLIPPEIEENHASYDLYHLPRSQAEELTIHENGRQLTITRSYQSRDELLCDPHLTTLRCESCGGRSLKQGVKWYGNGRAYHAAGICPEHGHIAARIRVKKAELGGLYADRCSYPIDEEEYARMQEERQLRLAKQREYEASKIGS